MSGRHSLRTLRRLKIFDKNMVGKWILSGVLQEHRIEFLNICIIFNIDSGLHVSSIIFFSNLLEIRENTSLYCFNGRSISFKRYALHSLLSLLWKHTLMTNQDVYKFHGGSSFLVVVFWMRKREPLLFFFFHE